MTSRSEILKSASAVRQLASVVRLMIDGPAFDALPCAEQVLVIEELQLLLMLEGVYLSRAELHAEPALASSDPEGHRQAMTDEAAEARERTYRASNLCPDCKGVGNAQALGAGDVPRSVFSSVGTCRRCNGSGRYVRVGAAP